MKDPLLRQSGWRVGVLRDFRVASLIAFMALWATATVMHAKTLVRKDFAASL